MVPVMEITQQGKDSCAGYSQVCPVNQYAFRYHRHSMVDAILLFFLAGQPESYCQSFTLPVYIYQYDPGMGISPQQRILYSVS